MPIITVTMSNSTKVNPFRPLNFGFFTKQSSLYKITKKSGGILSPQKKNYTPLQPATPPSEAEQVTPLAMPVPVQVITKFCPTSPLAVQLVV